MLLLIDAGNTRIKWSLVQGKDWLLSGVLPVGQAGELSQHLLVHCDRIGKSSHDIGQVWVSNVAGKEIQLQISKFGSGMGASVHFIIAREEQCGVRNGYSRPEQLGSDRWAALVGAWHLVGRGCLVVNSGTATTIDALSGQGEFIGGLILPGMDLMVGSLYDTTGQLMKSGKEKFLSGLPAEYAQFPRNTADAVFSGAVQASCGAIQGQHALLEDEDAPVVLSGGAAGLLKEHLRMPLRIVDGLVLQGLMIIAQEASGT